MKKLRLGFKNKEVSEPKNHILNDKSDFATVETFKTIRTNIMFSIPKSEKGKPIVITSSSPGEGKTTACINLAITFAQMGAKVIILDCDLRKSRVHRYLGVERKDGVSNVLCGFTELDSAIKHNVRDNLDCLTAGEIPPNPAELLGSDEFKELVNNLCKRYDYIFIDTPPVTVVTDALLAMESSIGVIVMVRQDYTTFDLLDITMESIKKSGMKILGVLMRGSEIKVSKYGSYKNTGGKYGYIYRYGYKYGYKYGDQTETRE
ncbi:MAG: CpsD/CapB family tyrosine-protein kinase [Clostridia bacterium]|nr:CpsD/CapB family tyrosine-protein kinase [Clostridia bacterium]